MLGSFLDWLAFYSKLLIPLTIPVTRYMVHLLFDRIRKRQRMQLLRRAVFGALLFLPLLVIALLVGTLGFALANSVADSGSSTLISVSAGFAAGLVVMVLLEMPLTAHCARYDKVRLIQLLAEATVANGASALHLLFGSALFHLVF